MNSVCRLALREDDLVLPVLADAPSVANLREKGFHVERRGFFDRHGAHGPFGGVSDPPRRVDEYYHQRVASEAKESQRGVSITMPSGDCTQCEQRPAMISPDQSCLVCLCGRQLGPEFWKVNVRPVRRRPSPKTREQHFGSPKGKHLLGNFRTYLHVRSRFMVSDHRLAPPGLR